MICTKCNKEIEENARYCQYCGMIYTEIKSYKGVSIKSSDSLEGKESTNSNIAKLRPFLPIVIGALVLVLVILGGIRGVKAIKNHSRNNVDMDEMMADSVTEEAYETKDTYDSYETDIPYDTAIAESYEEEEIAEEPEEELVEDVDRAWEYAYVDYLYLEYNEIQGVGFIDLNNDGILELIGVLDLEDMNDKIICSVVDGEVEVLSDMVRDVYFRKSGDGQGFIELFNEPNDDGSVNCSVYSFQGDSFDKLYEFRKYSDGFMPAYEVDGCPVPVTEFLERYIYRDVPLEECEYITKDSILSVDEAISKLNNRVAEESMTEYVCKESDNGVHNYEFIQGDFSVNQAMVECQNRGGHLVSIESYEEYNEIVNLIEANGLHSGVFLTSGGRDVYGVDYRWIYNYDGKLYTSKNCINKTNLDLWLADEPSYYGTYADDEIKQEGSIIMFYNSSAERFVYNDASSFLNNDAPFYHGGIYAICEYE